MSAPAARVPDGWQIRRKLLFDDAWSVWRTLGDDAEIVRIWQSRAKDAPEFYQMRPLFADPEVT